MSTDNSPASNVVVLFPSALLEERQRIDANCLSTARTLSHVVEALNSCAIFLDTVAIVQELVTDYNCRVINRFPAHPPPLRPFFRETYNLDEAKAQVERTRQVLAQAIFLLNPRECE